MDHNIWLSISYEYSEEDRSKVGIKKYMMIYCFIIYIPMTYSDFAKCRTLQVLRLVLEAPLIKDKIN